MDVSSSGSSVSEALANAFRLNSDRDRAGQEAFTASPFSRLLVTQMLSLGGDALVTLALANSVFFSTNPNAARGRVTLVLLITMAPFAVVAPLLGPLIDKTQGGRRVMVMATALGRAVACFFMARYIHSLFLFPAAFLTLVCSKGYTVAKATLVPAAVRRPQDLVEANSKLAVSGAIAGFLIALPGLAILKLAGGAWLLRVDVLVFLICAASALRLQASPRRVGPRGSGDTAVLGRTGVDFSGAGTDFSGAGAGAGSGARDARTKPLPGGAIQVLAFSMGTLRLLVGFTTFLVVFGFRINKAPTWWFGVALVASICGNTIGSALGPWLRSRLKEELIIASAAATVAVAGILAMFFPAVHSWPAASMLAAVVGLAAGLAKLAFDALVQRHIPPERQGRAFGRFEAGFQLVWVLGGLVPVVIAMSLPVGFAVITLVAAMAAVVLLVGTRMARTGKLPAWWPGVTPGGPRRRPARAPAAGSGPAGSTSETVPLATVSPDGPTLGFGPGSPEAPTVAFGTASPYDEAVDPYGAVEPAGPPYDDVPWMDPPADLGTYPPPISGPPPLRPFPRPVPPPLTGPPPIAAPLAPRPPRQPE